MTRAVVKPTHMIGGYAQQSYGFNYYGTVGSNRDEFVIVRKMRMSTGWTAGSTDRRPTGGSRMKIRAQIGNGAEPRQVHRLSHLFGHLQERLDQPRRHGIRLVQQRRDQARHRLSQGVGEPEKLERRLGPQAERQDSAEDGRQVADPRQDLRQSGPAGDRRLLRALHLRLRPSADGAGAKMQADRAAALADHRRAHGEDRMGTELGGDPGRRIRKALEGLQLRGCREGNLRRSSKTPS